MNDDNLQLNIATDADFGGSAAKRAKKSTRRSYSFRKHQVTPILSCGLPLDWLMFKMDLSGCRTQSHSNLCSSRHRANMWWPRLPIN